MSNIKDLHKAVYTGIPGFLLRKTLFLDEGLSEIWIKERYTVHGIRSTVEVKQPSILIDSAQAHDREQDRRRSNGACRYRHNLEVRRVDADRF
jgi:hypothetical protein